MATADQGGETVIFKKDAYTLQAVIEAGIHPATAKKLLADGPRCTPMRPRLSVKGRRRAPETLVYVWGPDANTLLAEAAQAGAK